MCFYPLVHIKSLYSHVLNAAFGGHVGDTIEFIRLHQFKFHDKSCPQSVRLNWAFAPVTNACIAEWALDLLLDLTADTVTPGLSKNEADWINQLRAP
jgi:hypothetical protein